MPIMRLTSGQRNGDNVLDFFMGDVGNCLFKNFNFLPGCKFNDHRVVGDKDDGTLVIVGCFDRGARLQVLGDHEVPSLLLALRVYDEQVAPGTERDKRDEGPCSLDHEQGRGKIVYN